MVFFTFAIENVIYCRSGRRSKKAGDILANNGYKVIEMNTGYESWENAGKATAQEVVDRFQTPHGKTIKMYAIKHGSIRMQIGERWIYIDPVGEVVPPFTDYSNLPKADLILVTHEHFDHLDSVAIKQLTQEGTRVISNPQSEKTLGTMVETLKNGESKTLFEDWKLEAVPAYNTSPDKLQFHPKGRDNGYLLTIDGFRIYVAGDTEDIEEMENIKGVDVAFLPCNLPYTMSPEQFVRAAKKLNPKVLFPYHYGETCIEKVAEMLKGSGIDVRIRNYK